MEKYEQVIHGGIEDVNKVKPTIEFKDEDYNFFSDKK